MSSGQSMPMDDAVLGAAQPVYSEISLVRGMMALLIREYH